MSLMTGCASHKTVERHEHSVTVADSAVTETKVDGHSHQEAIDMDSLVTASVWQAMQELTRDEREQETVTETITTAIDSLGRTLRTEQRTTSRSIARQEAQRTAELHAQIEATVQRAIATQDSIWQQRLAHYETHKADSARTDLQTDSKTGSAARHNSFPLALLIALLVVLILVVVARKHLKDKGVL